MRKTLFFIVAALLLWNTSMSNHIVGGEIELVHVSDFEYDLNLIQYFDKAQNENPGPDPNVTVHIYRSVDDTFITTVFLNLLREEGVNYTNPDCAIGSLKTSRVIYNARITLDAETYSDQGGYYVVWERCCRNGEVDNIINPLRTGMTYILDFPAVMDENGNRFINSSPQLFPPLSDYACINQIYYTDFKGVDADGDSIVYSLTTPLNSSEAVALPTPTPKPHDIILFKDGFDEVNMIPGSPSLNITPEGYLTVNPTNKGLYVFSVLIEEYRDQIKIGELRRDFQMLVVDGCEPPTPPRAEVRLPGSSDFYNQVDVIKYSTAEEKCFEFLVKDDAGTNVTLTVEGVNFDENASDIISYSTEPINEAGDTLRIEVCISDCPPVQDKQFIIDLIASDNACPLPQRDTVRMTFDIQPPENTAPYFSTPNNNSVRVKTLNQGTVFTEEITGIDLDNDSLHYYFISEGYDPTNFGMKLDTILDEAGKKTVNFEWDTDCLKSYFGDSSRFTLGVVLEDYDTCLFFSGDTLVYDLEVILPPNTDPNISAGFSSPTQNIDIKGVVAFDVTTLDTDNDQVTLNAFGDGFSFKDVGINFSAAEGTGSANSEFSWNLSCDNLGITEDQTYVIYFVSEDSDECKDQNQDTLTYTLNINVPENNFPEFDVDTYFELTVNETFELDILATDFDALDKLSVDLFSQNWVPPSESFLFVKKEGTKTVAAPLSWTPECSLLGENRSPEYYTVHFLAWDDNCPNFGRDTLTINFKISELDVDYGQFLPPNAFSPNGDGINDTYFLHALPNKESNLPPDNCGDQFQSIIIFDRSGSNVFSSRSREFEWTGIGAAPGTYYYQIDYENSSYKGVLTLVR